MIAFKPDWPAPENIVAYSTTRLGGVSVGRYAGLNPALHVGDDAALVSQNRQTIKRELQLPADPVWLNQTHGTEILGLNHSLTLTDADGAFTSAVNRVCVVQTADCLPVLLCDRKGQQVAAIHAGWRGLAAGILEHAVARMQTPASQLMAWFGPAISVKHFEVGPEVYECFVKLHADNAAAFQAAHRPHHFMADIYGLAKNHLNALGLTAIYGGTQCTYSDATQFYSYRRDGVTGRMASLIYRKS